MVKRLCGTDLLIFCIIVLLIIITVAGLLSFQTGQSYEIINQYGDAVRIFGHGIYAHDSYFKAPIFIGSDCTILFVVVPLLIIAFIKDIKNRTVKSKLFLTAIIGTVLYYAASIALGVTYNSFHLLYIGLFSCSLFALIILIKSIDTDKLRKSQKWDLPDKGVGAFLVIAGTGLGAAWLPDIIKSLVAGETLALIEVYTTEITYVLDLGIISPLMLICLFLLMRKDGLGDIVLAILLQICVIIGIMLPVQTLFQTWAGIAIPIPVLITKVGVFVFLAVFAAYLNAKLYKNLQA